MQRIRTPSLEVALLRRGNDEGEQTVVGNQRTHWMEPRVSVRSDGGEKREPDAVLIQQRLCLRRHIALLLCERRPRDHAPQIDRSEVLSQEPARRPALRCRW